MLRLTLLALFIALSFVAVMAQQPQPSPAAADPAWVSVAPPGAGFTLLLPGKPVDQTQALEGHAGVENHILTLETKLAGYVVSYVQFPDVITDPGAIKELLDRGREGGLTSSGGTLKSEKEIKLNNYPGREWTMDLPNGMIATARAYWVRRRLLQAVFIVSPKADDLPELIKLRQESATKFFASFALTDDAEK